jgi:peroxiredoxin
VFNEGPRRAAYLMGNTGDVHFPVTTANPDAQRFFNQGVGQLHGFWFLEAERSFRQAASLDPACAMAYWGMALANFRNDGRARGFVAEAVKRKTPGLTPVEVRWIDAFDALYRAEPKDENERKRNLLAALGQMAADFPGDVEVKALLARYTWEYAGAEPIKDHDAVDRILEEVLKANPNHPAHHFRIHLWDDKDPARALTAAARNGPAAPNVAHMWHMPGHTYSKLNRFDDAAWAQEASARVDHAYMIRDRVMPYEIHNYAHNNEWLVRDLVFCGRVRDAIDLAKNMVELPRHPKHNRATEGYSGAGLGRARLIEVLAQHELWDEYLALCDTVYLNEDLSPDQQVERLRYLGVAAAAKGQADRAMQQIAALEQTRAKLRVEVFEAGGKAVAEAQARDAKPEEVAKAREDAQRHKVGQVERIKKAVAHIAARQAAAAGDHVSAAEQLAAADGRKEHQSQHQLLAGNTARAIELAQQAVNENKNQTYPLANQVDVLYRCGQKDEARKAFDALREISWRVDTDTAVYAKLQPIAAEFGYGADWRRLPSAAPADLGTRPALDTLGPFRWTPPAAPEFAVTGADGATVTLAGYQGKPVVVVFYLGYGCLHCIQQLNAFEPLAKEFEAADIALLAIGTDTPPDLGRAWQAAEREGRPFPFPLASDAGLDAFRRYHCYDDFEQKPLHGTFLIDARGRIRWRDVSHEPFTDTAFLLAEAKRLLAQP